MAVKSHIRQKSFQPRASASLLAADVVELGRSTQIAIVRRFQRELPIHAGFRRLRIKGVAKVFRAVFDKTFQRCSLAKCSVRSQSALSWKTRASSQSLSMRACAANRL
jgi:hypothetical protein